MKEAINKSIMNKRLFLILSAFLLLFSLIEKGWTIETQNLIGSDFYTYNTYTYPNLELYVMKQNDESVKNARNKIKEFVK